MDLISVVVPCYNEEAALPFFIDALRRVMRQMKDEVRFEVIIIDDGSTDGTLVLVRAQSASDRRFRYVSLSRNFGKESALYAGASRAQGDYVVMMDVDLQDPPELLPQMYHILSADDEGERRYDSVGTRRVTRTGEPFIRSLLARGFYRLISKMQDIEIVDGARDYRMMTRRMTDAVLSLKEHARFSKGIVSWVGFQTKWIEYENVCRVAGETKWSFGKLVLYALECITDFSTKPLSIATFVGILTCIASVALFLFFGIKAAVWGDPVPGFPTLICIVLFLGGVQLFCIGMLGRYLAAAYLEIKDRPLYIAKEES